jgi:phospholipid/cholesterol/gamma-HCH transport system substrate-binding protein
MLKDKLSFIVGLFITIGILIFVVLVFVLGGQHSTFQKKIDVIALFDDIGGLKSGDNIWLSGVKVGIVKSIQFSNDKEVLVDLSVIKNVQNFIHKDSKVKIGSDGLMGNRIVVIYGGSKSSPIISNKDQLYADRATDSKDMLAILSESNKNILGITKNLKEISKTVLNGEGTLGVLLKDPEIPKIIKNSLFALRGSLLHFKALSIKGEQATESLVDFSAKLNQEGGLANSIATDTVVFQDIRRSVSQLQSTMKNLNVVSENTKKATASFEDTNTTTGLVLKDPKTASHLKNIISNLDSASQKLDEDLEALQHNFLFNGYFKRKAKAKAQ